MTLVDRVAEVRPDDTETPERERPDDGRRRGGGQEGPKRLISDSRKSRQLELVRAELTGRR